MQEQLLALLNGAGLGEFGVRDRQGDWLFVAYTDQLRRVLVTRAARDDYPSEIPAKVGRAIELLGDGNADVIIRNNLNGNIEVVAEKIPPST